MLFWRWLRLWRRWTIRCPPRGREISWLLCANPNCVFLLSKLSNCQLWKLPIPPFLYQETYKKPANNLLHKMKAESLRDGYFFQCGQIRKCTKPKLIRKAIPVSAWNHAARITLSVWMCFLGMLVKTISLLYVHKVESHSFAAGFFPCSPCLYI